MGLREVPRHLEAKREIVLRSKSVRRSKANLDWADAYHGYGPWIAEHAYERESHGAVSRFLLIFTWQRLKAFPRAPTPTPTPTGPFIAMQVADDPVLPKRLWRRTGHVDEDALVQWVYRGLVQYLSNADGTTWDNRDSGHAYWSDQHGKYNTPQYKA